MYVTVDIGGTKTRIAASRDLIVLEEPVITDTPQDCRAALDALVSAASIAAGPTPITDIAIGAPGVLSRDKRILVHAPNLPGWNGAAIADDIEKELRCRVILENDAALVGLGESTAGAGKGASIVAYITISTGVNGVRVVDGDIDRAAFGFEIGEQYLGVDATAPTFEQLVSGRAISDRFGVHPRDLGKAHPIWRELASVVAIALHNTIAYWSPDRIVLGGSMMNEIGIPLDEIVKRLQALPRKNPHLPEIVRASLGDFGGLWSGMVRLRKERTLGR
ncbi:MAG: ROK family protein [Alphaproteobacteria bacterium]|nr:ROK family protein [Alphaproteobacteria bacterium]